MLKRGHSIPSFIRYGITGIIEYLSVITRLGEMKAPFVVEAALFKYPFRPVIERITIGGNQVEVQFFEPETKEGEHRFSCKSFPPIGFSDRISDHSYLIVLPFRIGDQADCAEELARFFQFDTENVFLVQENDFHYFAGFLETFVRFPSGVYTHVFIPAVFVDRFCIAFCDRTQDQPFRFYYFHIISITNGVAQKYGNSHFIPYLCHMVTHKITPRELWARQQISSLDVDYKVWDEQRKSLQEFSKISPSCIFTVDVFKERYDFASDNFAYLFGYNPVWIRTIRAQGDLLEERIHPDDRDELRNYQIAHGQFIYSLPPEERNNYQQIFQIRMLNAKREYVNVISRHQVIQKDRQGKAWIIMGMMDISPDPVWTGKVKRTVINRVTGEVFPSTVVPSEKQLTPREKEILLLISQGLLSKEIACKLNLSIYTVNNHRKNILTKWNVDNTIEAINVAREYGILF